MAMDVNGAAVLAAIAGNPAAFGMDGPQIDALALAALTGRLKHKTVGLDHLRSIVHAIGADDFKLALDHLAPKDALAVAKRVDPKHPDLRVQTETWLRHRIWDLADGKAEPVPAAPATRRRAAAPKVDTPTTNAPKTGAVMKSKALKAPSQTTKPARKPTTRKAAATAK